MRRCIVVAVDDDDDGGKAEEFTSSKQIFVFQMRFSVLE